MQDNPQRTAMTGETDAVFGREEARPSAPSAVGHLGAAHLMLLKEQIDLVLALDQRQRRRVARQGFGLPAVEA